LLAFGQPAPGLNYLDRPAAFGIVENTLGEIAVVRVTKLCKPPYFDLPGGAVDPGETEPQAVVREFGEETGLVVEVNDLVATVSQVFLKSDGQPVRNFGGVHTARMIELKAGLKVEDDHELAWLDPRDAVVALRHDAHAWAVAAWMRRG